MNKNLTHRLKLVSINTWKCDGDYHRRMDILTEQLKEIAPDIICCQEAFQSHDGITDTLKRLSHTLNMSSCFAPLRNKTRQFSGRPTPSASGLGILSKFDFSSAQLLAFPDHPKDRDRAAQLATFIIGDKKILLVNTHLTHLKNKSDLRLNQVKTLINEITAYNGIDLTLICGDFNAIPESSEIQYATTHSQTQFLDMLDCFSNAENLDTCPAYLPEQIPPFPPKRIDYIFTTASEVDFDSGDIHAGLVLNQPSHDGLFASDHYGVYVDIPLYPDSAFGN